MRHNLLRLLAALVLIALAAAAFSILPHQAGAESAAPKVVDPADPAAPQADPPLPAEDLASRSASWASAGALPRATLHRVQDREYRLWVRNLWHKRAVRTWKRWQRPPRRSAWMCIHRHEGAWTDPNPPYYGGLQMDISFQRTYGRELLRRKGTADKWTPLEQIWVAHKAHRSGRGFYPWPNTARYCGLI